MCRQAAFPPGFPRDKALEIVKEFEGVNTDGVGSVYLKDNKFVVRKYPTSFSKIVKRGIRFLNHMPYDGWTVVHVRAASHGGNTPENTHPFIVGSWAITHNGVWSAHEAVRLALSKWVKNIEGETDSIVAAHLINEVGPKKFATTISFGGVYLALNKDGTLWTLTTSGNLEGKILENKQVLIASELPIGEEYSNSFSFPTGWVRFEKDGKYLNRHFTDKTTCWPPKEKTFKWTGGCGQSRWTGGSGSGSGSSLWDGVEYFSGAGCGTYKQSGGADHRLPSHYWLKE